MQHFYTHVCIHFDTVMHLLYRTSTKLWVVSDVQSSNEKHDILTICTIHPEYLAYANPTYLLLTIKIMTIIIITIPTTTPEYRIFANINIAGPETKLNGSNDKQMIYYKIHNQMIQTVC